MNKIVCLSFGFLFAIGLASCSFPIPFSNEASNQVIVGQYETVSVLLTLTSQVGQAQLRTPAPALQTVSFTPSALAPTRTYTPVPNFASPTPTPAASHVVPCDQVRAGMPIDVSIPDDTRLYPGDYFSKTWRLVNAGNCSWDRGYAVVWFSGDDLGITRAQSFNGIIAPGQSVDLTVDMQAPKTPGTYQSNWKLRSNQGSMFGIGPGGGAPFWVRVVVVPVNTDTPDATQLPPTASPTPEVFNSGEVALPLDTGLDLDSGTMNQIVNDDLRFLITDEGYAQLLPENGARVTAFGQVAPEFSDCSTLSVNPTPVFLGDVQPGAYLCFRTTEGLPGWVVLTTVDPNQNQVTLEFVTWAVP